MPVYEFRCKNCSKRFAKLIGMTADSASPVCPKCGSEELERLISRFTRGRSEDEILDSFEDVAASADHDNPKQMAQILREMGKTLAEDGEDDVDELIDEAEKEVYDASDSRGDAEFA